MLVAEGVVVPDALMDLNPYESPNAYVPRARRFRLRRPTFVELLTLIAILVVFAALLLPSPKNAPYHRRRSERSRLSPPSGGVHTETRAVAPADEV